MWRNFSHDKEPEISMNCKQCGVHFQVMSEDRKMLNLLSPLISDVPILIPDPMTCPECRMQQRMIWRGELHVFRRNCARTGKPLLSFYPSQAEVTVYSNDEWWSDVWDARDYGREYDFGRPFFSQFQELLKVAPLPALTVQGESENSDYVNCASWNKNCYLIAGANYNEDCYYGNYINHCKDCVDNNFLAHCELCYECVDCNYCYHLRYSHNCQHCSESAFLLGCRSCSNCFASVNLANKQYVFLNEQLTKEEYQRRLSTIRLDRRSEVEHWLKTLDTHRLKYPYRFMIGERNENVCGNELNNCKNAYHCFDGSDLEDCRYCAWFHKAKNCMDNYSWGFSAELCYECSIVGADSYHVLFSVRTYGGHECFYCVDTSNCKHCFGCVGLKRGEYCILNKQYSKRDYEQQLARIIQHLQSTGEWGNFFPAWLSPLPYNATIAQDYYPLEKKEALALGWKWYEEGEFVPAVEKFVAAPDDLAQASPDLCNDLLCCSSSGKAYKITKPEFRYYQEHRIPIPDRSFLERHKARLARRNPRQLWARTCESCSEAILTSYPPYRREQVYCEKCYTSCQ